jgi:rhodanese-related sulfurtransferase
MTIRRWAYMAASLKTMMAEARSKVRDASPTDVKGSLDRGQIALVLDVREREEWSKSHIPGAVNVPRGWLELKADPASPIADSRLSQHQAAPIAVYCLQAPGARSLLAAATLVELGYTNVVAIGGGLKAWMEAGLPVEGAG